MNLSRLESSPWPRRLIAVGALSFALGLPVIILLLLLTGCGPSQRNTGNEKGTAPTSGLTHAKAVEMAGLITILFGPDYTNSDVAPTGSMEPMIDSRSVIIYEPCDGSDLAIGQVVRFRREGRPDVLHMVAALSDTHFIPSGVSNSRYDGWVPRSAVTGRMVAQFYTAAK